MEYLFVLEKAPTYIKKPQYKTTVKTLNNILSEINRGYLAQLVDAR